MSMTADERLVMEAKLDLVWSSMFPKNIKFISVADVSDFPYPLFQDDEGINCAYGMTNDYITSGLRTWLKENVEHDLYLVSRDHSCYYGLSFFFTSPSDATKFAMTFGDKIHKVQ